MTPQNKAKELVDEMLESLYDNGSLSFKKILYTKAKECAMICVRELLKNDYNERAFVYEDKEGIHYTLYSVYWADVLIEISKL